MENWEALTNLPDTNPMDKCFHCGDKVMRVDCVVS